MSSTRCKKNFRNLPIFSICHRSKGSRFCKRATTFRLFTKLPLLFPTIHASHPSIWAEMRDVDEKLLRREGWKRTSLFHSP